MLLQRESAPPPLQSMYLMWAKLDPNVLISFEMFLDANGIETYQSFCGGEIHIQSLVRDLHRVCNDKKSKS